MTEGIRRAERTNFCECCGIYISNDPSSIRNHELNQRHKDNAAKLHIFTRCKEEIKEEKRKEIEAKAMIGYQKDLENLKEASSVRAGDTGENDQEKWDYDSTSGYYYNLSNGLHYDPTSGFYYSVAIGKWVTQEEAYATIGGSSGSKHKEGASTSLNPTRSVKDAPSAVAVKRKWQEERPTVISEEEKAALEARKAARKRVEEREKPFHGFYKRC